MKKRLTVLVVLAISFIAGVWLSELDFSKEDKKVGSLLLPKLSKQVNVLDALEVTGQDGAVHVVRGEDDVWRVVELHDYPASLEKIRRYIYLLSESKIQAVKTSDPLRYQGLGLADGKAPVLSLKEGDSNVVSLRLGNFDETFKGTYVLVDDDPQVVLTSEDITTRATPIVWVNDVMMDLSRARVQKVELVHASGDSVVLSRGSIGADIALKDVPAGKQAKNVYELESIASSLENLRFTDVTKASEVQGSGALLITFSTFDGMEVYLDVTQENDSDHQWVKAYATYNPALLAAVDQDDQEAVKAADAKRTEVQAEVKALNATLSGWLFKLDAAHYRQLSKTKSDLLSDIEKAAPESSDQ